MSRSGCTCDAFGEMSVLRRLVSNGVTMAKITPGVGHKRQRLGRRRGSARCDPAERSLRAWERSGYGYKRTFTHTLIYVRFTPESGHNQAISRMSANDPKRTFI